LGLGVGLINPRRKNNLVSIQQTMQINLEPIMSSQKSQFNTAIPSAEARHCWLARQVLSGRSKHASCDKKQSHAGQCMPQHSICFHMAPVAGTYHVHTFASTQHVLKPPSLPFIYMLRLGWHSKLRSPCLTLVHISTASQGTPQQVPQVAHVLTPHLMS
jgi:hypothetical protein